MFGFYLNNFDFLNLGLSNELADILISRKEAKVVKTGKVTVLQYDSQAMQRVFDEVVKKEKNLEILFAAQVDEVQVQSQQIKQIRVRQKNGTVDVKCRAVVDCSGNGDVIRLSGATYQIAPVEERQLAAYAVPIDGVEDSAEMLNLKVTYHLANAAEQGHIASHLRFSVWMPALNLDGAKSGQGVLRVSVLPSDAKYEIETIKKQATQVHEILRRTIPEFKSSKILNLETRVVEREGLRMCGRYTLTKEDILTAKKFEDGVVKSAWPVEFWDQKRGPRYDYLEDGQYYEIP